MTGRFLGSSLSTVRSLPSGLTSGKPNCFPDMQRLPRVPDFQQKALYLFFEGDRLKSYVYRVGCYFYVTSGEKWSKAVTFYGYK
jgi:hypothetical protein